MAQVGEGAEASLKGRGEGRGRGRLTWEVWREGEGVGLYNAAVEPWLYAGQVGEVCGRGVM